MTEQTITTRLNELTRQADARRQQCDGLFSAVMGGASFDFMTPSERQERHALMLQLPTQAEEREAAAQRIRERLDTRRRGYSKRA